MSVQVRRRAVPAVLLVLTAALTGGPDALPAPERAVGAQSAPAPAQRPPDGDPRSPEHPAGAGPLQPERSARAGPLGPGWPGPGEALAADGGVPGEGELVAEVRALWGDGLDVVRGERSLVAGHDAPPGLLEDLARRADTAGRRVGGVLGGPVRAVVLVPASATEAAGLAGVASVDGLAAVADEGRVIVVPEHFARLTPVGRDVVLAHELTHVAAGTEGLPVWLYEGFADYVAYRDAGLPAGTAAAELAAEVRAGRLPGGLPEAADFAPGADAGRLARAYQEAWLACRFLAAHLGEETLVRLYRDAQTYGADRALASLGLSTGTLTERWRAYVRDQLA